MKPSYFTMNNQYIRHSKTVFSTMSCSMEQWGLTKEDAVSVGTVVPQSYFNCFLHDLLPWNVREIKCRVPDGVLGGFGHI